MRIVGVVGLLACRLRALLLALCITLLAQNFVTTTSSSVRDVSSPSISLANITSKLHSLFPPLPSLGNSSNLFPNYTSSLPRRSRAWKDQSLFSLNFSFSSLPEILRSSYEVKSINVVDSGSRCRSVDSTIPASKLHCEDGSLHSLGHAASQVRSYSAASLFTEFSEEILLHSGVYSSLSHWQLDVADLSPSIKLTCQNQQFVTVANPACKYFVY